MDMDGYDVAVIGAGPAGAATARFLAGRGYRVALIDQARFPRDKVCGEFISPAADPILRDLGVLSEIESRSPMRLKGVYISAYEREDLWIDYPPMQDGGPAPTSLSLPRMLLDDILVRAACDAGVVLLEEHRADDLLFQDGAVCGIRMRGPAGDSIQLRSRMVVDAGGRNAISLRRLNLKQPSPGGRVALAAHWDGVSGVKDYCYMHVSRPGYTGMAKTARGQVNVVLVAPPYLLKGRDRREFYLETVRGNPLRAELLRGAEMAETPRAVESLAFTVKEPVCGGLLLVGDAMGFIDPFTGEGIYLALRSAQIASAVIDSALAANDLSRNFLSRYGMLRRREFAAKFTLSRILQFLLYRPSLCRATVRRLEECPHLAALLAGVIGDYMDASRILSASFIWRLLAGK